MLCFLLLLPPLCLMPAAGTPEQAALVRSELLLTRRLKELSHELSDASLQQVGLAVVSKELPAAACCWLLSCLVFTCSARHMTTATPLYCLRCYVV